MIARLETWWFILKICFAERLVYRGDFALGTLMRFLPIVTQIFLWGAIFAAMAGEASGGEVLIRNFTYRDMIAYYLLVFVGRAFSSMPGLASGVAREVREGTVKKFLIQPIDMIGFLLLNRIAHKFVYYGVAALPFGFVFWLCRDYFPPTPDATTIAAFVASLVMSFLLGFFLEASMGMISFWFLEVSSLFFVYMLFNFFCSGHMFPLDFLPSPWQEIVRATPLQYMAYFPAAVWLGKIQGADLAWGLAIQLAWVVFFIVLCRVLWARGVKRYSGFGG
ncbi:MAG: ABC transporter permease [Planctomycetota bacterium]|nr:MAG: ABC transporter permease [Planctomycetota bacterium]REJ91352.1 MAG: ABC transporter permease [Planctomycetota bacterium]REK18529.1 MAG: ABC transporter permease [Planctomycetota bacterium]REK39412.1 MAG: ABC transporter permease [Planctomycetota bacterium]